MNTMRAPTLRRVVQVTYNGRVFTFSHERDAFSVYWRVTSDGGEWRSFFRVLGNEQPSFFRAVALLADERGYVSSAGRDLT